MLIIGAVVMMWRKTLPTSRQRLVEKLEGDAQLLHGSVEAIDPHSP